MSRSGELRIGDDMADKEDEPMVEGEEEEKKEHSGQKVVRNMGDFERYMNAIREEKRAAEIMEEFKESAKMKKREV